MNNVKYFDSQQPDEEVSLLIRRHWFVLVPALSIVGFFYMIAFSTLVFMPYLLPDMTLGYAYNIFVLVLSLLFLITTNVLFSAILIYYLNVQLITNEHIVEFSQDRLFYRKISHMELGKIQDVTSHQKGVIQTILDFGQVEIQTAGELPNFLFENIPGPTTCAHKIIGLTEEYSKRHGIRSEVGDVNANIVKANQEEKAMITESPKE